VKRIFEKDFGEDLEKGKRKKKKEIGGLHPPAINDAPPCVGITRHLAFVMPNPSD
jgi:hypothetical protein